MTMTIKDFMTKAPKLSVTVTFGFLCFDTKTISLACFADLMREADRLEAMGATVHMVVVDNGSDDTCLEIQKTFGSERFIKIYSDGINGGQSHGRNTIILEALVRQSNFLLFVDGDIRVVPLSSYAMAVYMMDKPKLGCLSAHPVRQTTDLEVASKSVFYIHHIQNDVMTACTGYSMLNCEMLKQGIDLEEDGPFAGPGWGLEDDDFYLEMATNGWEVFYFTDMVYYQPKLRSSWPSLHASGIDIQRVFNDRKKYFLEKWRAKSVDPAILLKVESQEIPAYVPEVTDEGRGYKVGRWDGWPNYECLKCQFKTLWTEVMEKHQLAGIHVWGIPGQHPKPKPSDSNVPTY